MQSPELFFALATSVVGVSQRKKTLFFKQGVELHEIKRLKRNRKYRKKKKKFLHLFPPSKHLLRQWIAVWVINTVNTLNGNYIRELPSKGHICDAHTQGLSFLKANLDLCHPPNSWRQWQPPIRQDTKHNLLMLKFWLTTFACADGLPRNIQKAPSLLQKQLPVSLL